MSRLTPGLLISDCRKHQLWRRLPVKGEIYVKPGEKVIAEQVIAQAEIPGDIYVVKFPQLLAQDIEYFQGKLKFDKGQQIEKGQILFEQRGIFGLFSNSVSAQVSGTVEYYTEENAHLGIRLPSKTITLNAFVNGTVEEVEDDMSVLISTEASYLQCIFGVGGEKIAPLKVLDISPTHQLTVADFDDRLCQEIKGKIVVGGTNPPLETLQMLSEQEIAGLIVGSIDHQTLDGFLGYSLNLAITGNENLPFTLIVTEGFGQLDFSTEHLQLLQRLDGKLASINGATQIRAGAVRPEIIISDTELETIPTQESRAATGLEIGKEVKIIRYPYFAQKAVITELPHEPQLIDTGAYVRVAKVKLKDQSEVLIPRANLEV